jgi:hypothetical protein
MTRHVFVVLTNAVAGQEDEYNDWYNNRHLPDVLACNGFVAAQRFKLTEMDPGQEFSHRYLALYEVETDDLAKTNQALTEAASDGAMFISPALNMDDAVAKYFTPITERVTAETFG